MTALPPVKINLGCGDDLKGQGVINFDWRLLHAPQGVTFIRGDLRNVLHYFERECADEVWALECLEHFGHHETRKLLDDWTALVIPGGTFWLEVPDLEALARFVLEPKTDPAWTDEMVGKHVYGIGDYPGGYHKMGFTRRYVRQLLAERGMLVDEITTTPRCHTSMLVRARKGQ